MNHEKNHPRKSKELSNSAHRHGLLGPSPGRRDCVSTKKRGAPPSCWRLKGIQGGRSWKRFFFRVCVRVLVSKNRGGKLFLTPQNGWFIINGNPYFFMDDLGGFPLFLETPIQETIESNHWKPIQFKLSLDSWKLHQNRDVKDIASSWLRLTMLFFASGESLSWLCSSQSIGQTQVYDLLLSPWRILECRQVQHCWALKSAHVSVSGLQGIEESGEDTAFQWVFRGKNCGCLMTPRFLLSNLRRVGQCGVQPQPTKNILDSPWILLNMVRLKP